MRNAQRLAGVSCLSNRRRDWRKNVLSFRILRCHSGFGVDDSATQRTVAAQAQHADETGDDAVTEIRRYLDILATRLHTQDWEAYFVSIAPNPA